MRWEGRPLMIERGAMRERRLGRRANRAPIDGCDERRGGLRRQPTK